MKRLLVVVLALALAGCLPWTRRAPDEVMIALERTPP
jgi:hypothetical protein